MPVLGFGAVSENLSEFLGSAVSFAGTVGLEKGRRVWKGRPAAHHCLERRLAFGVFSFLCSVEPGEVSSRGAALFECL